MADKVLPGPVDCNTPLSEAVCIHTHKIFDSCREYQCQSYKFFLRTYTLLKYSDIISLFRYGIDW